jgi:hypothetical protein
MTDLNTSARDFDADSDALMGTARDAEDETGTFAAPRSATHRVGEKVREIANTAQTKAGEQVRTQLDSGKNRAATALRDVASSLMNPNAENPDAVSRYIRTAGDQVQRAADYLENSDVRRVVSDVERFARRQPALFLGGAFMVGLVAARVLKSSRRETRTEDEWNTSPRYDRERSLDSFREPSTNFGSGVGATGAALGGAPLGDNDAAADDARTYGTGNRDFRSRANSNNWSDDIGTTSRDSDPFANE